MKVQSRNTMLPNKWKLAILAVLLIAFWTLPAKNSKAFVDEPMTVYQYFMLLPNDYFFEDNFNKNERRDCILNFKDGIVDNQHDYLFMHGGDGQWSIEMAIFRNKGIDTIAVRSGSYDPNIPSLDFFHYKNGKWIDVTKALMPIKFNSNYDWSLPQYGTTIVAKTDSGKKVLGLRWVNGRFMARRYK